jgi:hypothetical protein
MTNTAVAADVTQSGYILTYLTPELAAYDMTAVYDLRNPAQLIFGQLIRLGHLLDASFLKNPLRFILADSIDIRQGNPYRLLIRYINAYYTRHIFSFSNDSALSLFMSRIAANNAHNPLAPHNPAILTYPFY